MTNEKLGQYITKRNLGPDRAKALEALEDEAYKSRQVTTDGKLRSYELVGGHLPIDGCTAVEAKDLVVASQRRRQNENPGSPF